MSQKCQILTEPKTSVFYLTKLIGLLSSTAQAILPARIQLWYLQQEQILALQKKKKVLQWSCDTGEFSQELRKLETLQWEQTSAARPHMIIQTDASTKGWRHTAGFNSFKA